MAHPAPGDGFPPAPARRPGRAGGLRRAGEGPGERALQPAHMPLQGRCFDASLGDGPCFWEGEAAACTTPHSSPAVSFQRNPRSRRNLIKHLLCSLISHGTELLMRLGSSLTRCWGSVAPLRRGGVGAGSAKGLLVDAAGTRGPALFPLVQHPPQPLPSTLTGALGVLGVDSLPQVLRAREHWVQILLTKCMALSK